MFGPTGHLRSGILSGGLGAVDIDEAVSGLMARHVAHGHLTVFFWGQTYGGSQEAIATGVLFAVLGQSTLALKAVPMLACAASAWLLWRLGRRTVGEPAASVASVLLLIGPGFFVLRSTRAYGFYGTGLFVCTAVLLAVVRLRERSSTLELAWLGLLVGLGWWATPQVAFVILPAMAWLVWTSPRVRILAWRRPPGLGLLLVVAGAYPFLFSISPASYYVGSPATCSCCRR